MAILSPKNNWIASRKSVARALSLFAFFNALFGFCLSGMAQGSSAEYRVKAAFILNFTRFVEWPKNAFESDSSPLVIGILGTDPFGKSLDETVQGETVNGRKLEVRRFTSLGDVEGCHVLFVSATEARSVKIITQRLQNQPVLTVGDGEGFTKAGGMIALYTENRRIRFRVNAETGRRAGLTFSSKLLRLADAPPAAQLLNASKLIASRVN